MSKYPKVSIVVPIYNVENYLNKCLDSLVSQTLDEIEIICVNDGSTDASGHFLTVYKKEYSNIIVINKENGGLSSARNAGLIQANGEYIAFVDADDWVEPDYYTKMYNAAKENSADLVISNMRCYSEKNKKYYRDTLFSQSNLPVEYNRPFCFGDISSALFYTNVSACNKIIPLNKLKNEGIYFVEGYVNEDHLFHLEVLLNSERCVCINNDGYIYRNHRHGSIMSDCTSLLDFIHVSRLMAEKIQATRKDDYLLKTHFLEYAYFKQYAFLKRTPDYEQEKYFNNFIRFWSDCNIVASWPGYDEKKKAIEKLKQLGYRKWKKRDQLRKIGLSILRKTNLDYPLKNLRRVIRG